MSETCRLLAPDRSNCSCTSANKYKWKTQTQQLTCNWSRSVLQTFFILLQRLVVCQFLHNIRLITKIEPQSTWFGTKNFKNICDRKNMQILWQKTYPQKFSGLSETHYVQFHKNRLLICLYINVYEMYCQLKHNPCDNVSIRITWQQSWPMLSSV